MIVVPFNALIPVIAKTIAVLNISAESILAGVSSLLH